MAVVVFEGEDWGLFSPLALTRHVAQLPWGTRSLLESASQLAGPREVVLWGREELREVVGVETSRGYNVAVGGDVLMVRAGLRPTRAVWSLLERAGHFAAVQNGRVFAARVNADGLKPGVVTDRQLQRLARGVESFELPSGATFEGLWQLVESNGMAIADQAASYEATLELPEKVALKGPASNLRVHDSVEMEGHVSFDTRLGPVVIGEGTTIDSFTKISGPCYLGPGNRVRSALLRGGTSVFDGCVVGGEVENAIMMGHSNKAHVGYLGDSIVGEWVNLGAGSVFSNLKNTYGTVRVDVGGRRYETAMLKLGPFIGDMAKVSIGAMIFAGKSVGISSQVTGLVDRNVPSFTYYDGPSGRRVELLLDSVIETQRRMMERRGMILSKPREALIRRLFGSTRRERSLARVRRGNLRPRAA